MFCRNCGQEIENSALCCPHCGTPVSQSEDMVELQDLANYEDTNKTKAPKKRVVAIVLAVIIGLISIAYLAYMIWEFCS